MTSFTLRSVTVRIDGHALVSDVDLFAGSGEFVGLVGPNGAGKTTVLRAIAGSMAVSGDISIGDEPVSRLSRSEWARSVSMVPQRPELPPDMRVIDYVMLGRAPHLGYFKMEGATDLEAVHDAIESLDLEHLAHRQLGALSGGEQQRAVLARSLAQASPILLLDEPTAALDVGHAQQVLDLVDRIRRSCGLTVVAALHDLTLAAQFCDRLIMVAEGAVVAEGLPATVLTEPIIRTHYGASVRVLDDGRGGIVVIPIRDSHPLGEAASMAERS